MHKLVSVEEMRAIEIEANKLGLTYENMMENAGRNLAKIVLELLKEDTNINILGLIGSGNNGGDTLISLTILANKGWNVKAYLVRSRSPDDPLIKNLTDAGGIVLDYLDDNNFKQLDEWMRVKTVVLDGVLGTGAQLPLKVEVSSVLRHIKQKRPHPYVIAVDCPSGIDCNLGFCAEETIPADVTICMAAVKTGMLRFPAYSLIGKLIITDIGLSEKFPTWKMIKHYVFSEKDVQDILPQRDINSHKGTYGTLMIVAGSVNYTGAAMLAARSACRIGTGLVRLAVPGPLHGALAGHLPEVTWLILPHEMGVITEEAYDIILSNLDHVTALLIGPGLGLENTTAGFINRVSRKEYRSKKGMIGFVGPIINDSLPDNELPPLIIDADGLKLLARTTDWYKNIPSLTILTPHPGEMSVLTGLSVEEIQQNRMEIAIKYAHLWGHIIVLKGALTIIAHPDGKAVIIPIATSALAHAGTGDVLAGIIAGLRAQKINAFESAIAATWIHAQAGQLVARQLGTTASVLAGDIMEAIPEILKMMTGNERLSSSKI